MSPVVIENPILNSLAERAEPTRHFRFSDEGITNDKDQGRRVSQYFVPIPQPRKKERQMALTEWTQDHVRERVTFLRNSRYPGLTKTTARLLECWQHVDREPFLVNGPQSRVLVTTRMASVAQKLGLDDRNCLHPVWSMLLLGTNTKRDSD